MYGYDGSVMQVIFRAAYYNPSHITIKLTVGAGPGGGGGGDAGTTQT